MNHCSAHCIYRTDGSIECLGEASFHTHTPPGSDREDTPGTRTHCTVTAHVAIPFSLAEDLPASLDAAEVAHRLLRLAQNLQPAGDAANTAKARIGCCSLAEAAQQRLLKADA